MARRFSLFARRPPAAEGAEGSPDEGLESRPPERETPAPASRPPSMRRERAELLRQREVEIRDVGGLALEMVRRDRFRPDLLLNRCNDVLALEERIHELGSMLAAADVAARGPGAETCRCGAPIVRGSHFCSHCGRPATETPPVATCRHCGQPLPAEANFCLVCGNAIATDSFGPDEEPIEATMAAPAHHERRTGGP